MKNFIICVGVVCVTILCIFHRPITPRRESVEDDVCEYYASLLEKQHNPYLLPLDKNEYKKRLCVNKTYKIYDVELSWLNHEGFASLFNIILIDDDLQDTKYCETLCHEILHQCYYTSNERFVEYMTFVTLYESSDECLRNVGIKLGVNRLRQTSNNSYWCKDLIIKYLKGVL